MDLPLARAQAIIRCGCGAARCEGRQGWQWRGCIDSAMLRFSTDAPPACFPSCCAPFPARRHLPPACRSKLQQEGWKFVVTGHSLGSAVATLLGMHLRERFSDLHVWAFNPPGGLLSWELSQVLVCMGSGLRGIGCGWDRGERASE